jgi:hypothetical protein
MFVAARGPSFRPYVHCQRPSSTWVCFHSRLAISPESKPWGLTCSQGATLDVPMRDARWWRART